MTDTEIDFNTCQDIRNFFDDFAHKEISKENPNRQLDGEIFRKDPVDIASAAGKTIHQGLFPESVIISTMNEALKILHREDILVLVRLGLFHYFFAYIHPFYDGNGRTDRFITSYFLGKFSRRYPLYGCPFIYRRIKRSIMTCFLKLTVRSTAAIWHHLSLGFWKLSTVQYSIRLVFWDGKMISWINTRIKSRNWGWKMNCSAECITYCFRRLYSMARESVFRTWCRSPGNPEERCKNGWKRFLRNICWLRKSAKLIITSWIWNCFRLIVHKTAKGAAGNGAHFCSSFFNRSISGL